MWTTMVPLSCIDSVTANITLVDILRVDASDLDSGENTQSKVVEAWISVLTLTMAPSGISTVRPSPGTHGSPTTDRDHDCHR